MKKVKTKASARSAAELLASQATSVGGFGSGFGAGFGAAFGSAFSQAAPSAAAAEEDAPQDAWSQLMASRSREQQEVHDPALVLAFKQLSKRDPVTRVKALDSIKEQFSQMDAAAAGAVLQPWLLVYERTQLDNDRRVRERLYHAFAALLSRLPAKQLQPHLKATFPLWFLHMQDPCAEVARASTALFHSTFPTPAKRVQVLVYCHREYFAYCASLFAHTPQTLSDQSVFTPEESQDKWERIIACAMASLADFIDTTTTAQADTTAAAATAAAASASPALEVPLAAYQKLLTPAVFKLAKCKTVHVRRALYVFLHSLVSRNPSGAVDAQLTTLAPLVLIDLLAEAERSNHQAMLDVLLTFMSKFGAAAWETLMDASNGAANLVQTGFYPRFRDVLQNGLHGNWAALCPCLLPLMSLLPDSVQMAVPAALVPASASAAAGGASATAPSGLAPFYAFFFGTLWDGRKQLRDAPATQASGSNAFVTGTKDLHALLDAYIECLLFALRKRRSDATLLQALVHTHFIGAFLAPALHFASTSSADPSVNAEVRAYNRFGTSFFERAGRALRSMPSLLSEEQAAALWTDVERVSAAALRDAADASHDAQPSSLTQPAPDVVSTSRRAAPASAAAATIDSFVAVGVVLSVAMRAADADAAAAPSLPLIRCGSAVFRLSLAHFAEQPSAERASALKLAVQLAESFTLTALLSSSASSSSSSSASLLPFYSSSLLPLLRALLQSSSSSAAGASASTLEAEDVSSAKFTGFMQCVEVFCSGLLAHCLAEMGLNDAASAASDEATAKRVWEELLQLLSSSLMIAPSASASVRSRHAHLSMLRVLVASVFARCPSVYGHAVLQDVLVSTAEQFLTCDRADLLSDFVSIFRSVLSAPGLLGADVLSTVLASFLEAVVAYQRMEGDFAQVAFAHADTEQDGSSISAKFVAAYEQETGSTVQALPALVQLLGVLLADGSSLLDQIVTDAAERNSMRTQLIHATFWLCYSPRAPVSQSALSVWMGMDRLLLRNNAAILLDLASVFRTRVLQSPLSVFTSAFIRAWSDRLGALVASADLVSLQQQALDAALPRHEDLRGIMSGAAGGSLADAAERVRVIRDLLLELVLSPSASEKVSNQVQAVTERTLFLGETSVASADVLAPLVSVKDSALLQWSSGSAPRLMLLLDLLAIDEFLRCFEREADADCMPAQVRLPLKPRPSDDDLHTHQGLHARLQRYMRSNFLSTEHVLQLLTAALAESNPAPADGPTALTASSRAYTTALVWLLRFLHDNYFIEQERVSAVSAATRAGVHKLLVSFLSSTPASALRSQDDSALFPPLAATLVAVLESGCVHVDGGHFAAEAALLQISKTVLGGVEAGMRLLSKSNARLFALSSPLRVLAACLRAMHAMIGAGAGDELQSTFATTRSKLLALVPNLNLFDPPATGAAGFSSDIARFWDARSALVHALLQTGGDSAFEPIESLLPLPLLQTAVLWSANVLRFAMHQHIAAIEQATVKPASASSSSASAGGAAVSMDLSAAWRFDYLSSTFGLMADLMPRLLPPQASAAVTSTSNIASALQVFVSSCFSLLSKPHSPLLRLLSVKHFTPLSVHLECVIRSYRDARVDKLMDIVRETFRDAPVEDGRSQDSAELRTLFLLLAHPLPCVSLSALHFLSVGLLARAVTTSLVELNEDDEMRHVLAASAKVASKVEKKRAAAAADAAHADDTDELALKQYRDSLRHSYRSAHAQRRVDQLLPQTLQRILEQRMQVDEVNILEEEDDGAEDGQQLFFAFRPLALQLRGQLLTWHLVLDLLSQSVPVPAAVGAAAAASASKSSVAIAAPASLSDEKSSLLVTYLRDGDLLSAVAAELIEHMLVSLNDSQVSKLTLRVVAQYEHGKSEGDWRSRRGSDAQKQEEESAPPAVVIEDESEDGTLKPAAPLKPVTSSAAKAAAAATPALREFPLWLAPSLLLPMEPRSIKVLPFLMKRLLRLRRAEESDVGDVLVDSRLFFGPLACLLYLRTLRVLPALSRQWFSHVDRHNGAVISQLTSSSFSPLLIQDELLNVTQRQQAALADGSSASDDDEEEFSISSNYDPSQWQAARGARATPPPAVVYAKFTRGEIAMGLSLRLPSCYPLLPVSVSLADAVQLKEEQSKKWLLSVTSLLSSSDGRLYAAVQVWRRSLQQHFQGVAECSICMSVVHATNHALPRMRCKECNQRFHSQCLFKWFQSSGNSKCPLCRTLFSA